MIGVVTSAIIFLYVLISPLTNQQQLLTLIRRLNPSGGGHRPLPGQDGRHGAGTVKGQFIIALVQGIAGATSIYIAGFHNGFFISASF